MSNDQHRHVMTHQAGDDETMAVTYETAVVHEHDDGSKPHHHVQPDVIPAGHPAAQSDPVPQPSAEPQPKSLWWGPQPAQ